MHYPETGEERLELAKKVAVLHAQTVMDRIRSMPYPTEQKIELLNAIRYYIKKEDGE